MPRGLFEPDSCRKVRWMIVIPAIAKGRRKCKAKNRVRVGLSTEIPLRLTLLGCVQCRELLRIGL